MNEALLKQLHTEVITCPFERAHGISFDETGDRFDVRFMETIVGDHLTVDTGNFKRKYVADIHTHPKASVGYEPFSPPSNADIAFGLSRFIRDRVPQWCQFIADQCGVWQIQPNSALLEELNSGECNFNRLQETLWWNVGTMAELLRDVHRRSHGVATKVMEFKAYNNFEDYAMDMNGVVDGDQMGYIIKHHKYDFQNGIELELDNRFFKLQI